MFHGVNCWMNVRGVHGLDQPGLVVQLVQNLTVIHRNNDTNITDTVSMGRTSFRSVQRYFFCFSL